MSLDVFYDGTGTPIEVDEGESPDFWCIFKDGAGNQITDASLLTIEATLLNKADNSAINLRDGQDVYNDNNGTVDANGKLTIKFQPEDMILVDTTLAEEEHILIIAWTWNDGATTRKGIHKWSFLVANTEEADEAVVAAAVESVVDLSGIKRVKTKHMEIEAFDPRIIQAAKEKQDNPIPCFGDLHFCKGKPKC